MSKFIQGLAKAYDEFWSGIKTGTLTNIELTWGGAGNQIMTIDGVKYATWHDWSEWPERPSVVRHKPYKKRHPQFGHTMLCTELLK